MSTKREADPEAEKRSWESWAETKGFLPKQIGQGPGGEGRQNPEYWKLAGAQARWADGQQVTEAEFDEAIAAVVDHPPHR